MSREDRLELLTRGLVCPAIRVQILEPCAVCQKPVRSGVDFCEACGEHAEQSERARKSAGWPSFLLVFAGVARFFTPRGK